MSEFETELVKSLNHMGNTNWVDVLISLLLSIIPALVVYLISNRRLELQTANQNLLEIQKEKRMLATQIRLDKYDALFGQLTDFNRLVDHTYINIIQYNSHKSQSLEETIKKSTSFQFSIEPKITKIEILSAYHPELRKEWDYLLSLYKDIENIVCDGFTFPNLFTASIDDPTFEHLKKKYELFNLQSINIREILTASIVKIIKDLESDIDYDSKINYKIGGIL